MEMIGDKPRCQAIRKNGQRCSNPATFANPGWRSYQPRLVCDDHGKLNQRVVHDEAIDVTVLSPELYADLHAAEIQAIRYSRKALATAREEVVYLEKLVEETELREITQEEQRKRHEAELAGSRR